MVLFIMAVGLGMMLIICAVSLIQLLFVGASGAISSITPEREKVIGYWMSGALACLLVWMFAAHALKAFEHGGFTNYYRHVEIQRLAKNSPFSMIPGLEKCFAEYRKYTGYVTDACWSLEKQSRQIKLNEIENEVDKRSDWDIVYGHFYPNEE